MSQLTLPRGVCVISIDTELAWGGAHHRDAEGRLTYRADAAAERQAIVGILQLFARYDISATWAVVGHLFLDGCQRDADGRVHPELPRPDPAWLDGDWLDIDPVADPATAPEFYGPDVVDMLKASPVPQEIGSHSFTHLLADDPGTGAEVLAAELAACQAVAARQDLELRSFVFPRNGIAHLDVLAPAGFTCFRGGRPLAPFAGRPRWRRLPLQLVDRVRPLAGSTVLPAFDAGSGVANVPQTYLFAPDVRGRRLPTSLAARSAVARLRQAARHHSLFHMWFHPSNVSGAPSRALDQLERICRAVATERDRGRLEVKTMGQVAAQLQGQLSPAGAAAVG